MASFILPPSFAPRNSHPADMTAYTVIVEEIVATTQSGIPAFCTPDNALCYQDHFLMAVVFQAYPPSNRRANLHFDSVIHLPDYQPRPMVKHGVSWLIWTDPQTDLEVLRINRTYLSYLQP